MNTTVYRGLERFGSELEGVFALSDLRVLLNQNTDVSLYRTIARLVEDGDLIKVMRGLYALPTASLESISARIEPTSYISTGTVLASVAAIGSIPVRKLQAVKIGRPRTYSCSLGVIEHLSISPNLFFGYTSREGRRYASPEKAFLDVCYYCFKGRKFSFDPDTDINTEQFDQKLIAEYLKQYDERFKSYYARLWGAVK